MTLKEDKSSDVLFIAEGVETALKFIEGVPTSAVL